MMKYFLLLVICYLSYSTHAQSKLDKLAEQYVKLGLRIGLYDGDFVDAYYGPDSLKPKDIKKDLFPATAFLNEIQTLQASIKNSVSKNSSAEEKNRAGWLSDQLRAFAERIKIINGKYHDFDREALELFGVRVPHFEESYFKRELTKLDKVLPGKGTIAERFQSLANQFTIPVNKLDTVFKVAIEYSGNKTRKHFNLPSGENCSLQFVNHKPWGGYNWYQGNYFSKVEINTDLKIHIERVVDVASHESYPGHHVYNVLLEQNLYRGRNYVEISLYPLFSPQSLIAEGSANYGVGLAFPDSSALLFSKNVLLPLAGVDTNGIARYYEALKLMEVLDYARNEVARGMINQTMNEEEAIRWLQNYELTSREGALKYISFIKKYRTYVINYNYGKDLVKGFVELGTHNENGRWKKFEYLLSSEIRINNLLGHGVKENRQ